MPRQTRVQQLTARSEDRWSEGIPDPRGSAARVVKSVSIREALHDLNEAAATFASDVTSA